MDKIKFKTQYNDNKDYMSESGQPFIYKRIRQLNKIGETELVITEKVDGQAIIESYSDSCDINNIVASMSIDTYNNLVNDLQNAKQFIDTTKLPKNIFELQNLRYIMQDKFNHLPSDIKDVFSNNYNQFMKAVEDGSINDVVKNYFVNLHSRSVNNAIANKEVHSNNIGKSEVSANE